MREIKFRAWSSQNMQMYNNIQGTMFDEFLHSAEFEVMQYTGVKDKNGKEIYEGDIVEWDDGSNGKWHRRCEVLWVPAHYVLKGYYYDTSTPDIKIPIEFSTGAFIYEKDGELEVIGNIYEDPELLNHPH